ncbi:MAG TPA: cytochrome C biogenesis protein [Trueperaceae bacterium]|nr:cytochrome C biogenesis protein [Trueperaceae bacterium]
MDDLKDALSIFKKDLLQEWRSKAVTVATVFFASIVLMVLAFALGSNDTVLKIAAPGVLWVALAFAGIISAAQSYQNELEENALEQLLLYPIARSSIFLGKLLANWFYMSLLGFILVPVTSILFKAPLGSNWWLILVVVLLGTLGFSIISSFYAALTANLRARESLLPVLMFPIVIPILQAAVKASRELMTDNNPAIVFDWLQLLIGFDLIYFVVTLAVFHFIMEE